MIRTFHHSILFFSLFKNFEFSSFIIFWVFFLGLCIKAKLGNPKPKVVSSASIDGGRFLYRRCRRKLFDWYSLSSYLIWESIADGLWLVILFLFLFLILTWRYVFLLNLASPMYPDWGGSNSRHGYVPWPGIEPTTLCGMVGCSKQLSNPARAWLLVKLPSVLLFSTAWTQF